MRVITPVDSRVVLVRARRVLSRPLLFSDGLRNRAITLIDLASRLPRGRKPRSLAALPTTRVGGLRPKIKTSSGGVWVVGWGNFRAVCIYPLRPFDAALLLSLHSS